MKNTTSFQTLYKLLRTNNYHIVSSNNSLLYFSNHLTDIDLGFYYSKDNQEITMFSLPDFTLYNDFNEIIKFINFSYSIDFNTSIFNDEIIIQDNPFDLLSPISKDEFEKLIFKVSGNSKNISSRFVFESDLSPVLTNFFLLDQSFSFNKGKNGFIFNEIHYELLFSNQSYYKLLEINEEEYLITANPYIFSIYNLENEQNSLLLSCGISQFEILKFLSKLLPGEKEKLKLAYFPENNNDTLFSLKFIIAYYNYHYHNILNIEIKNNIVSVSIFIDKNNIDAFNDILVWFAGMSMLLNKKISNKYPDLKNVFDTDNYSTNNYTVKQIVFPFKSILIDTFIPVFLNQFKLNDITLYNDLDFSSEEEEHNGMFQVIE